MMRAIVMMTTLGLMYFAGTMPQAAELDEPIEILADDGTKIGDLAAERHYIPFDGLRGDARLGVTSAGHIYVALAEQLRFSSDGGRNWKIRDLPANAGGFGVIADDIFVLFTGHPTASTLRSTDLGKTWSDPTPVDISPFDVGGGGWTQIIQLENGPALMTCQCYYEADAIDPNTGKPRTGEQPGIYDHVYRSTDGGKTWGDRSLICRDSAESSVIRLKSGKMLAAIRKQRHPQRLLPFDDVEQLKAMDGWRNGNVYIKHGFLADSYDKGYNWENERLAPNTPDMKHGLCPSDLVQLPDGRVVWIYTHRYGQDSGVMARLSNDDGETWSQERYRVRRLPDPGHGTYPTNTVLKDGTILTVCGKNHGNRAIAIRWKPAPPAAPKSTDTSNAKHARRKVLNKRRRIIFNDDTYEMCREDANTPEGFLRRRLKPLVGTHVDTISWSVLGGWGDAPVYDSKVQPILGDAHDGPPNIWSNFTASNLKALIQSGNDPLQVVIDFAKENGMELFASVRMNDCHDSFVRPLVTKWKQSHPELLVDRSGVPQNPQAHPLGLYAIAQDFTHQEVRDRKFEIIEEVCRRYYIDGIDLNFMRHPVFFTSTMRGKPASQDELDIMNQLVRRIRRLADEEGTKRGRPILMAAIVPDSIEQARHIGLDVPAWIEQDLIDIVIPGLGYSPFTLPVQEWIDLAHRHGVKVHPCINRKAPQQVPSEQVSEGFRGVASNWYRAGADGIFFWNLGTPLEGQSGDELVRTRSQYYASLPELGDPQALRGKDKLFCIDDEVLSYYQHVSSIRPLPLKLAAGRQENVSFDISDEFATAADSPAKLELELEFKGINEQAELEVTLNGKPLNGGRTLSRDAGMKIEYSLDSSAIRLGENVLAAALKEPRNATALDVRLDRVRLWVRYGK